MFIMQNISILLCNVCKLPTWNRDTSTAKWIHCAGPWYLLFAKGIWSSITDQNNEVTLEPIKCTAHSCCICRLEVHNKGIHFSEMHNIQIYIDQNIGDKGGFLSLKLRKDKKHDDFRNLFLELLETSCSTI